MKKRVISLLMVFLLLFTGIGARLFFISTKKPREASKTNSIRTKTISATRGRIYDTNLLPLVNSTERFIAIIKPTAKALVSIKELKNAAEITEEIKKGTLILTETESRSTLPDSEDIITLTTFERYSGNTAAHILGYVGADGNGVSGIEKYYNNFMIDNYGELSAVYHTDALGRVLIGEPVEIRNTNYDTAAGIVLTIDKDIQRIAENALKNNNIEKGAAVVLDVKTGEILVAASVPTFDRDNMAQSLKDKNSPFINRAFSAYSVGSVFKVVTAAAALENGIGNIRYNCTGSIEKSGNLFYCNKRAGHNEIDMKDALTYSCNTYFIELSTRVGGKMMIETAKKLGFSKAVDLGNGYTTDSGALPDEKTLNSDAAVGNIGFGQGYLTATPLQLAACFAAIANNGEYNTPKLVKGEVDADGKYTEYNASKTEKVLSESTCNFIKNGLLNVIKEGTGKSAATSLFDACGKTASAQSGQKDDNGNEIIHTWFAGFFPYEKPEYVIVIM